MSCNQSTPNVNKTFIIESQAEGLILSACTTMYTNLVESCSGDTSIQLSTGMVNFNSNVSGVSGFTANTIEATTYYSGGTNLLDIFTSIDTFVTGGTFSDVGDSLSLVRNDGANIIITGITNFFTTGGTYDNNTNLIYFDRNDQLSAFTVDLSTIDVNDTFVTGGTLSGDTLILDRNDNNLISIDLTNIKFSGGSGNCISDLYVTNIYGCSPIRVNDELIALSGITFSGTPSNDNTLTEIIARDSSTGEFKYRDVASIISAATSQDTYLTGNTFINDTLTSTLNDGSTVTTVINTFNSLSATTMSAGTLTTGGITTSGDIIPTTDNTFVIGTPTKRFREVNTVSGTSSYWKSTTVSATTIDLGLDSSGNTRIINANNSIIKNDCLDGGTY